MFRRDIYHDTVKGALEIAGYTIIFIIFTFFLKSAIALPDDVSKSSDLSQVLCGDRIPNFMVQLTEQLHHIPLFAHTLHEQRGKNTHSLCLPW